MGTVNVDQNQIQANIDAIAREYDVFPVTPGQETAGQETGHQAQAEPQETMPQNNPDMPTVEILVMFFSQIFNIAFPGWEVSPENILKLAEAWAPVADKYLPGGAWGFVEKFRVELTAIAVTYMVVKEYSGKPRTLEPDREEPGESQEEKAPETVSAKKSGELDAWQKEAEKNGQKH